MPMVGDDISVPIIITISDLLSLVGDRGIRENPGDYLHGKKKGEHKEPSER
jgi:hypothetical protein